MLTSSKLVELGQMLEKAREHKCEKVVAELIKEIRTESDRLILSMGGETVRKRTKKILEKKGRLNAVSFYRNMTGQTLNNAVDLVNQLEKELKKEIPS